MIKIVKIEKEYQTTNIFNYELIKDKHKWENKYCHNHNANNDINVKDTSNGKRIQI